MMRINDNGRQVTTIPYMSCELKNEVSHPYLSLIFFKTVKETQTQVFFPSRATKLASLTLCWPYFYSLGNINHKKNS
jgi:hypothetical protein